ncbi:hypothetical protein BGZ49_008401 [Haplosporangium sp. Z 27]|nr:hypothetical protein BGZ49_008401 [Haplosporangium sp. Z 27]
MDSTTTRYMYQPDPEETAALFLFLACISLMSLLIGRKTAALTMSSFNYAKGLVLCLYLSSWLFSFMAAMLASTNDYNQISCTISNFVCILVYAGSKVIIYLFLVERVHVVTAIGVRRWNSRIFQFNIALLTPSVVIIALALKYRVSVITENGQCEIGLTKIASASLITYDIFLNIWLTTLFVRALVSSTSNLQGPSSSKLRAVAHRTLTGTILSLILSTGNIASIVYYNGHERGVLCLSLCALDVTLNACIVHWVTSPRQRSDSNSRQKIVSANSNSSRSPLSAPSVKEKQVSPLESHVSVSIESYVEEYHQTHIADKATLQRGY